MVPGEYELLPVKRRYSMNAFYMGNDASKGYGDFVILDAKKQEVEPNFQLDDTFDGHRKLYEILEKFFHNHSDCTLYAAVESTGGYEDNWYHFLVNCSLCFNIKTARLNPFAVSKHNQAGMKRNRTDKISARDIAEYLINHPDKVSYQKFDPMAPLKSQWNYIELLNKQKVQLLNVLEKNLYRANTELVAYCKSGVPRWLLKLVQQFPTAKLLAQATLEELTKISYVSSKRAQRLIEKAQTSVASSSDPITAERINKLAKDILDKQKDIDRQKKLLGKHRKLLSKQIELLKSFKGIGTYSAVGLLILIGDVHDFESAKKLASFFGLHPVFKKSGDGTWDFHMSKQGSTVARQILYMVTLSAIRWNPFVKEIFANQLKKGMKKMAAIGVCMHKILRVIYGMLKNNQPFDPEIDKHNRLKQWQNSTKVSKDSGRRYQSHDSAAPISRRQTKKRKEQAQSQNQSNSNLQIISNIEFALN
jgi:transposase